MRLQEIMYVHKKRTVSTNFVYEPFPPKNLAVIQFINVL